MEYKIVKCNKQGGCYNCKDTDYDMETYDAIYKQEEIFSIFLGNTGIRLCDDCLEELKQLIIKYQENK